MSRELHKILLTGSPGCGKTTAVMKIVRALNKAKIAGFCTEEIWGAVETDDVPDALAAAWMAAKAAIGQATTQPEHPTTDRKGLRMEILLPVCSDTVRRFS